MNGPTLVAVKMDLALLGTVETSGGDASGWVATFVGSGRPPGAGLGDTEEAALRDLHDRTRVIDAARTARIRLWAARAPAKAKGVAA